MSPMVGPKPDYQKVYCRRENKRQWGASRGVTSVIYLAVVTAGEGWEGHRRRGASKARTHRPLVHQLQCCPRPLASLQARGGRRSAPVDGSRGDTNGVRIPGAHVLHPTYPTCVQHAHRTHFICDAALGTTRPPCTSMHKRSSRQNALYV